MTYKYLILHCFISHILFSVSRERNHEFFAPLLMFLQSDYIRVMIGRPFVSICSFDMTSLFWYFHINSFPFLYLLIVYMMKS